MIHSEEILAKLKPNQKVNYDKVLQKMVLDWKLNQERPTILLHTCCAPCSTTTLEYLADIADVTVYFANSNIHPRSEYEKRKLAQQEFIDRFNRETRHQVAFISAPYLPGAYLRMVKEQDLAAEPETGKRCTACFQMRLDLVAEKAKELDFDYFASSLTLSPKKNSQLINQLGLEIQQIYTVKYLPSDFKKNNGYQRSLELCKQYDVYRQCYCGCVFAAREQGIDFRESDSAG